MKKLFFAGVVLFVAGTALTGCGTTRVYTVSPHRPAVCEEACLKVNKNVQENVHIKTVQTVSQKENARVTQGNQGGNRNINLNIHENVHEYPHKNRPGGIPKGNAQKAQGDQGGNRNISQNIHENIHENIHIKTVQAGSQDGNAREMQGKTALKYKDPENDSNKNGDKKNGK